MHLSLIQFIENTCSCLRRSKFFEIKVYKILLKVDYITIKLSGLNVIN